MFSCFLAKETPQFFDKIKAGVFTLKVLHGLSDPWIYFCTPLNFLNKAWASEREFFSGKDPLG